ncbi:6-phosphogluconolactonase [Halomonas sp. LBP4]|uniref:6-phosphogluconolactonase n=1 Tax=Halomonas sp. LBP4 TaxID=2044917 RepID=UPI000D7555AC|nr:6-phosphogluconolactonase [Halomonas sp. LBP4]PXX99944.1 6-phosphogluconolactonase [Halomonas sp. LBP4]
MSDASRERLAAQLAEAVAEALRQDLATQERALLVVSGGSTPVPFFEALAARELPWERVQVTLADERWVAEDAADSNARLVREHLLKGPAAAATFVPLTTADPTPEQGAATVAERVEGLAWPASVVILGMGGDGHTASLFPDSQELALALATDAAAVAVRTPSQPQPRITLSADRLHQARRHVLHISGGDKRAVLARALAGDDSRELPIRAFLSCPLATYWAP